MSNSNEFINYKNLFVLKYPPVGEAAIAINSNFTTIADLLEGNGISGYSGYSGSGISGYSGYSGYSGPGVSGFSGYSGSTGYSIYINPGNDSNSNSSTISSNSIYTTGDIFNTGGFINLWDEVNNQWLQIQPSDGEIDFNVLISAPSLNTNVVTSENGNWNIDISGNFYTSGSFFSDGGSFYGDGSSLTNLNASNLYGIVPTTSLGTGTASSSTFLRGDSTWQAISSLSGYSGYSGSGISGYSGYSGKSGYSGYSGNSTSGYSGYSGIFGLSGYSGYSGSSGYSGYSGATGTGSSGYSGYSGYSPNTTQTLTYASPITWNVTNGVFATLTLTGSGNTFSNPTNISAGGTYVLIIKQDSTGSRTIGTWSSAFKWAGGAVPILSTTANAIDIISFVSDGTNMFGVISKSFA